MWFSIKLGYDDNDLYLLVSNQAFGPAGTSSKASTTSGPTATGTTLTRATTASTSSSSKTLCSSSSWCAFSSRCWSSTEPLAGQTRLTRLPFLRECGWWGGGGGGGEGSIAQHNTAFKVQDLAALGSILGSTKNFQMYFDVAKINSLHYL